MIFKKMFFLILAFFPAIIFSQGEAAVPFLLLPTSPKLNSAGAAGTASLTNDPYKFFFNPAHLGYSSRYVNLSSGFYPAQVDWLPVFNLDLTINSYAFNAGYNFEEKYPGLPISVGFGYSRTEIDYGTFLITDENGREMGSFDSRDYCSAYSVGIGYHTIVNISAGVTIKDVTSKLSERPIFADVSKGTGEVTAVDYGLLINLPLNNLLNEPLKFYLNNTSSILTDINYSVGYSIQNVGDEIYYVDVSQSDPIGRTARLAHNLQLDASLQTDDYNFGLFKFSYSIDAEDILIKKTYTNDSLRGETKYQGLFGDIRFGRNLFLGKGNPEVVLHKGVMIEFFEILTLAKGGFSGRGFDNRKTDGVGLRLKGLLKLVNISLQNETVKFIADHFDVEYYNTNYFSGHELESKFSGMMITVGGF